MTGRPSSTNPVVLLFDIMGTVVYDPFHCEIPAFFDMDLDRLLEEKHPSAWVEFELGRLTEKQFLRQFFRDERRFDHEAFRQHVRSAYEWIDGMESLLSDLSDQDHTIHAFSNYPVWYRMIEERLGLSRFLQWTFVSWKTGYRKPDPASYHHVMKTLGVPPEGCFFVDDREKNCRVAGDLGMHVHRFTSPRDLRQCLRTLGVLN